MPENAYQPGTPYNYPLIIKKLLNIPHHFQCEINGKNTGVLSLVFF